MRLFIAVEIPDRIRDKLASFQKKIGDDTAKIKWVETDNIHLTLKFLGEVDESKVEKITECLKNVKFRAFGCSITGLGTFPDDDYIKVIWAGVEPEEEMNELHKKIDSVLEDLDFQNDDRFHSHITIGRVRSVKEKEKLKSSINGLKTAGKAGKLEVENFKLKKSTLTPNGPVYEDVAVFDL